MGATLSAPLLPVAVAFTAGVWLGLVAPAPGWVPAAGGLLLGLAWEAARRGRLPAATIAVLVVVSLAGWARLALPDPGAGTPGLPLGVVEVEGVAAGEAETDGPRTRLALLVMAVRDEGGWRSATGRLSIHLYGRLPPLRPLDHVRVTVQMTEPRPFRNPGNAEGGRSAGRPAPPLAVGRADSVRQLAEASAPWWLRAHVWVHEVVRTHLPAVSGALFEGLLIGERHQLPPTLVADFRAAGVFHVLAISGFNVGLVAAAVFLVLRLLRLPSRAAAALALVALAGFAAVVGAQPSVLRATIMAGLMLAGQLLTRESTAWNSLAAALVVLVAWEPAALVDPGLQLSFAATAGILHLAPPIRARLEARWPRPLATALAVSAGAQLAVTPLMLAQWNQLSLVAIVANLAVVPLAALITTLGLLAVATAALSDALAHLEFQGLWLLLLGLRATVRTFAAVPAAVIYLPTPPPAALIALTVALVLGPVARGRRVRSLIVVLAAFGVVTTAWRYLPDGRLHVLVLDVGQGDAILVRGPDGKALLVDTGGGGPGRADRGERVVLPVLHRLGVRRLAALAVTHADPDHAGGLPGVVGGIPVDEVWVPAGTEDAGWPGFLETAGVPRRVLARGDRVWLGPLLITVLHPPPGAEPGSSDAPRGPPEHLDANNRSLVLRVEWGLVAVLLTGDAEAPAEADLLAAAVPLPAPVLKVGHHGSRNASSGPFLAAVAPRFAMVSVGARNPFGHPTPAALARLAAAGARIYRTDFDGAIEITTDAELLRVRLWARPDATEELVLGGAP